MSRPRADLPPHSDMVVIGGGLIGLASALAAARAGLGVTLLEAEHCGRFASGASAGGVRSLDRHPAEIPLARAALDLWRRLPELIGDDGGYVESGQILVAEDDAALGALERRRALVAGLGYHHERLLGATALRWRAPRLSQRCKGALIVEDDGFADPLRCIHGFRQAAVAAGVAIVEGCRVSAIEPDGTRLAVLTPEGGLGAELVVNAAGAWGGRLAATLGEPVPLRPAALQMVVTERLPPLVAAVIISQGRKLSLKQAPEGGIVIGGGFEGRVDLATGRTSLSPVRVGENLANAARLFPELRQARVIRSWAGIEGMVEDDLPVLGASATTPGVIHAFGFSGHGFALAPLVGQLVADLGLGRPGKLALTPFAIERFRRRDRALAG